MNSKTPRGANTITIYDTASGCFDGMWGNPAVA